MRKPSLTQRALMAIAEAEDLIHDINEAFKDDQRGGDINMKKFKGGKKGGKKKGC